MFWPVIELLRVLERRAGACDMALPGCWTCIWWVAVGLLGSRSELLDVGHKERAPSMRSAFGLQEQTRWLIPLSIEKQNSTLSKEISRWQELGGGSATLPTLSCPLLSLLFPSTSLLLPTTLLGCHPTDDDYIRYSQTYCGTAVIQPVVCPSLFLSRSEITQPWVGVRINARLLLITYSWVRCTVPTANYGPKVCGFMEEIAVWTQFLGFLWQNDYSLWGEKKYLRRSMLTAVSINSGSQKHYRQHGRGRANSCRYS